MLVPLCSSSRQPSDNVDPRLLVYCLVRSDPLRRSLSVLLNLGHVQDILAGVALSERVLLDHSVSAGVVPALRLVLHFVGVLVPSLDYVELVDTQILVWLLAPRRLLQIRIFGRHWHGLRGGADLLLRSIYNDASVVPRPRLLLSRLLLIAWVELLQRVPAPSHRGRLAQIGLRGLTLKRMRRLFGPELSGGSCFYRGIHVLGLNRAHLGLFASLEQPLIALHHRVRSEERSLVLLLLGGCVQARKFIA